MEVGTGLFTCQRRPDDERSFNEIYDEMLALGGSIEEAGLDSAWVSEHHFAEDGYLSGTMPSLGALAAVTSSVSIGTCIALAPLYDPIRIVEDAATVDLISDGRMHLGLSIGYRDEEFDGFGLDKSTRVERTMDVIELARSAWSESNESLEYPITPPPAGRGPPILLGGSAKPAVRRAARHADGWIAPSSLDLDAITVRVEDIHRVRETEGIERPFQVYVLRHGFIDDDADTAWAAMRDGYLYLQRTYASWYAGEPIDELAPDRRAELRERAIIGNAETVADDLERIEARLGADVHVILRTYYPGIGTERMRRCIHRLGDEVLPLLA